MAKTKVTTETEALQPKHVAKTPMPEVFAAARRVSVPIIAISTADQMATVDVLIDGVKFPAVRWDAVRGLTPINEEGKAALASLKGKPGSDDIVSFVGALTAALAFPQTTMVFAHNAHRQIMSAEPGAVAASIQAVANVRDQFKKNYRTLVLLAPGFSLPSELDQDAMVLMHDLPDRETLGQIVDDMHEQGKVAAPTKEVREKAVEAVSGLSAFAAEQQIAVSFRGPVLDLGELWERKRVTIEQTRGLKVYRGRERFSDVVGLDAVKAKLGMRITGRTPVGVAVFMDEIDKVLANVELDTSGVRMDQLRTLLAEMEDNEWEGLLLTGLPGGGKSMIAKAFGNEAGVPTISLDLGAMQGSLVGESEQHIRHSMAVLKAIGNGNAYFIATSNNATVMRPELQRRFTGGFFFVDVLSEAQRDAAWADYGKRYPGVDVSKAARPNDDTWTGAEIRNCVRDAWNSRSTIKDSAKYILPVARARAQEFEAMRQRANGRFLDANKPGHYAYEAQPMKEALRGLDLSAVDLTGMGKAN